MLKGLLSLIKQRHGCASALGTFRTSFASLASCAGLEPEGAIQLACSGSSRSAWANAETPSSVSGVFPASGAAAACILQQSRHFSEVLRHRPKVHKHDQPKTQPVKVVSGRPLQQGPTAETNVVPEASRASAPEVCEALQYLCSFACNIVQCLTCTGWQVAGVVDHEALVITRNIEWYALSTTAATSANQPWSPCSPLSHPSLRQTSFCAGAMSSLALNRQTSTQC